MSSSVPFVLLLIACQLTFGDAISPEAENPIGYRLPTDARPTDYDLWLEPDLKNFVFEGRVTIGVTILQPTNSFTLNAKNLNVTTQNVTVKTSDGKANLTVDKVEIQAQQEFLIVRVKEPLVKGNKYNLIVKFAGELNEQNRGFYRSKYYDENYNKKYIATTHFEPTGARLAFPCWDEPEYKATFQISLTHSKDHRAISNTAQVGEPKEVTGTNKVTTTFEKSQPMSTYLVAFVVSDYESADKGDKNFRVWTKKHAVAHAELALDMGKKLLEQLDRYTGISYNRYMTKMDQVTVKDFSPSAMENWGLVTYRETSLLYEEGVSTTRSKQSITTVIAHEFAHQWFGNLVSPKWWKYIWLNEGFANYMQYFITKEVVPDWRLNELFVVESLQGSAFVADASQTARPMNHDAETPSEISKLFDSIAYQKAGSVIRMMSHILTEQVFQRGIQTYLEKHKLSVAESSDLLNVLQNMANKTWEGVKLDELMDAWVNKPGYPVVSVSKDKDGNFVVSQERFLLDESSDDTKWWVPLTFTYQSNAEFNNTEVTRWLKPTNQSLVIANEHKNDWVIFNKLQTGYYRVNYDRDNWQKLDKYLKTKEYEKIAPINRAQLIDDALHMARTNRLNYTDALSLTIYLNGETDYVPWTTMFRNLNFLHNMLRTSDHYADFQRYLKHITQKVVKNIGFQAKKDDGDLQKLLRVNVLKWACRANDQECKKFVKEQYETWLKNSTVSLDADLKSNIFCAGVRTADQTKWNATLNKLLESTKDEDEKKSLLAVLGCSDSPDIVKNYLRIALEKNLPIGFDTAVQNIVSESKIGVDVVLKVFIENFDQIKTLDNSASVIKSCIEAIANGITDKEHHTQLSLFVSKKGLQPEYQQIIADKAVKNLIWVDSHRSEVEHWLQHQDYSSATSVAITSFLLVLSAIVTRYY